MTVRQISCGTFSLRLFFEQKAKYIQYTCVLFNVRICNINMDCKKQMLFAIFMEMIVSEELG